MRTYLLSNSMIYLPVEEDIGEPFAVMSHGFKILQPWGVRTAYLGEDVTAVTFAPGGDQELVSGYRWVVIQERLRDKPIQLGEFFVGDLQEDNYLWEVKRQHGRT